MRAQQSWFLETSTKNPVDFVDQSHNSLCTTCVRESKLILLLYSIIHFIRSLSLSVSHQIHYECMQKRLNRFRLSAAIENKRNNRFNKVNNISNDRVPTACVKDSLSVSLSVSLLSLLMWL